MSIFHLSAQIIGRSSGRSSTAAAAYRAGCRIVDVRTGEAHDFTRKRGVREAIILAPEVAPTWMRNRVDLWNGVEAAEKRKDAQLAREIEVALPHELPLEARRGLLVSFVIEEFVNRGMVADVAMHAPGREGDRRNEHAHIMLTLRHIDGEGFGQKAREWNDVALVEQWRESWARRVNAALEDSAILERVNHRSYARQALAAGHDVALANLGTVHLGAHASAAERRGVRTVPGDLNREVRVVNLELERARRSAPEDLHQTRVRQSAAFSKLRALNAKRAELDATGRAIRQQAKQYSAALNWRRENPILAFLHILGIVRFEAAVLPSTPAALQADWDKARQEYKQLEPIIAVVQSELDAARQEHGRLRALVEQNRNSSISKPAASPDSPAINMVFSHHQSPDAPTTHTGDYTNQASRPKPRIRSNAYTPSPR